MAEQYNDNDADVTNDTPSDAGTVEAGPIRYDPTGDGVGVSSVLWGAESGSDYAESQEWSDLRDAATSVGYLGVAAYFYSKDPLSLLIYAGLNFLVDVIQPLDDALGYVTGNPERMAEKIAQWDRIGTALTPLATDIRSAADDDLISWQGKGAEAAKRRLHEFADGIEGLANDTSQLSYLFTIAKSLMEAAQYMVMSIITAFIEWLIMTWIPALAAAGPTFGGSTAAAGAATAVKGGMVITKVSRFIQKVAQILLKLRRVLYKMHPKLMRRVQSSFQRRGANGRFQSGFISAGQHQRGMLTNPATYLPFVPRTIDLTSRGVQHADGQNENDTDGLDPNA